MTDSNIFYEKNVSADNKAVLEMLVRRNLKITTVKSRDRGSKAV